MLRRLLCILATHKILSSIKYIVLSYSFHECEHPVVAQLGGHQVEYLQKAAKMLEEKGYDEINFNCGCPSNTVSVCP